MRLQTVDSSEMPVHMYQTTRRHIQANRYLHSHRRENLKSHKPTFDFNQNFSKLTLTYGTRKQTLSTQQNKTTTIKYGYTTYVERSQSMLEMTGHELEISVD